MAILVSKKGSGSLAEAEEREELRFKARMTEAQFRALALRLDAHHLIAELPGCRFWTDARRGRNAEETVVERWLKNAWNTERLLRATSVIFERDELGSALQWSFPQAYYSAFAATLAYFHARSFTESTHRSVIAAFGAHVAAGRYPDAISFAISGHASGCAYHGIEKPGGYHPIDFDPANEETVRHQICQFLKSTHEMALDERRHDMRKQFKTTIGKVRERLRDSDWAQVATATGYTSLLGLLYRKRIKANYGDIDTFLGEEINAAGIHADLTTVVSRTNFVHEALIARTLGLNVYQSMVERFQRAGELETLTARLGFVRQLCAP